MTSTSREKDVLDYMKILQSIDVGARKQIYETLLKGENGQPGLEKRFVEVLSQLRVFETHLSQRNADLEAMPEDPVDGDGPKSSVRREVAGIVVQAASQRAVLQAIASELAQVQKSLDEIRTAGT
jgi:hypothetical protein